MRISAKALLTVGTLALALLAPSTASAATRYASPTGANTGLCTSPDPAHPTDPPCKLQRAVESFTFPPADQVILAPGTYTETDQLLVVGDTIHGTPGQPRPEIISSAATGVSVLSGATLRDVNVKHSGIDQAVVIANGTVEQALVHSTTAGGCAAFDLALIRDTVCWASSNANSSAVTLCQGGGTASANLRNVTAVATGTGGQGIYVCAATGASAIDAKNTIAFGALYDAVADILDPSATATVTFTYSNYDTEDENGGPNATVTNLGSGTGNQTALPHFVDAATGDFHQAATSPTINAGAVVDLMGSADLDGQPRNQGTAPDIGADEFVPPATNAPPGGNPGTSPPQKKKKKCKKKAKKGASAAKKKCKRKKK